jgi:hypothetical protein
MQEEMLTSEWLISYLEADTGSGGLFDPARSYKPAGVYFGVVPDTVDLPAIRLHVQVPHDVRGAADGAHRIMVQLDWLIVLVISGYNLARVVPLANALDTRLHDKNGSTAAVDVFACVRLEPFSMTEVADSGVVYRHIGGLYRTVVKAK